MRKARVSIITQQVVILIIITLFAGCGGGGGGSDASSTPDTTTDPGSIVTFTCTIDPGQINSLPIEADRVKVILDDMESTAEITSRMIIHGDSQASDSAEVNDFILSFNVSPGEHSYTVYALQGSKVLETIGPITFTKVKDVPFTAPLTFYTNQTDVRLDTLQTYSGTAGNDTITYEVCIGTDTVLIDGGDGTDSLSIKQNGNSLRIQDGSEKVIYLTGTGGTTITVVNVENITVLDEGGNTIWPTP
jgi:Ca2+-binding RTX toxin-like protein